MSPAAEPPSSSDRDALGRLFDRCWPRLLGRIRLMMGDAQRHAADSGDVLGSLSVRILEKLARFEVGTEADLMRLATVIARSLIIDEYRRPRVARFESVTACLVRGEALEGNTPTPSHEAARAEEVERMFAALEALAPEQRDTIQWRDFDGLPFAEIGRRLGRSENAVQLLHKRALRRLGAALRA